MINVMEHFLHFSIYRFQVFMIYEILSQKVESQYCRFIHFSKCVLSPWDIVPTAYKLSSSTGPFITLVQIVKEIWDFLWHFQNFLKIGKQALQASTFNTYHIVLCIAKVLWFIFWIFMATVCKRVMYAMVNNLFFNNHE